MASPVTNLRATSITDTRITVAWTNPSQHSGTDMMVYSYKTSSVVKSETLGSSASSYTFTGAAANNSYQFIVQNLYNGESSTAVYLSNVCTTPAKPTSVALVNNVSSVTITVNSSAPYAEGHQVQVTNDGGSTWTSVGTATGQGTRQITDNNPPAGNTQYRARSYAGSLYSDWTYSTTITRPCAPSAPTITSKPASAIAVGSTATLTWEPNHPDGTAQSKAQVEVTSGGSTTTIDVTGATTTIDLSSYVESPASVSVRVRTYGTYAEWGAWSETVSFASYDMPTVTVTSPSTDGEVMRALPVVVTWYAEDATGISSQTVRLLDSGGTTLKSWTVPNSDRSFSIGSDEWQIANLTTYGIQVDVTAGSSFQASSTRTFATDYVEPAEPIASAYWYASDMSCAITVTAGDDQGGTLPATVSFYVLRVNDDGSTTMIASGLESGQQAYDNVPPLGVDVTYRVVAVAASGAESVTEITTKGEVPSGSWLFSFGSGAAETISFVGDPEHEEGYEHSGERYHFSDGTGDGLPMWYGTIDFDVTHTWSFTIGEDRSFVETVRRLFRENDTCWVRDPFGHRWYVSAKAKVTFKRHPYWTVSIDAYELRYREAI